MDWTAFALSLRLSAWTTFILLPIGVLIARNLAWRRFAGRGLVEAVIALPLVLPPTVLGYYLLISLGDASPFGHAYRMLFGRPLVFTFQGLLVGSVIINLPFVVQPIQRAFEAVPHQIREAAWCSGLSKWRTFIKIELPLAWPGLISALALTFAHTMGEFGVVLMLGGNIPGQTKTASVAIYDQVQSFHMQGAASMSALLVLFSLVAIGTAYGLTGKVGRRHG